MEESRFNRNLIQQESSFLGRIKRIISNPTNEWQTIDIEESDNKKVIVSYLLPLLILSGIILVLEYGLYGKTFNYGEYETPIYLGWIFSIKSGLSSILCSFLTIIISAVIIKALAESFKSVNNYNKSLQLIVYSSTPVWIGSLFSLIPIIALVGSINGLFDFYPDPRWFNWASIAGNIFGVYGLYIMYTGMIQLLKAPKEKAVGFVLVSALIIFLAHYLLSFVVNFVLSIFFMGSYYSF